MLPNKGSDLKIFSFLRIKGHGESVFKYVNDLCVCACIFEQPLCKSMYIPVIKLAVEAVYMYMQVLIMYIMYNWTLN